MSGKKHDSTKIRLELIPAALIWGVGSVLTFGARKYGDRNWEEGISYGRVFGALMRHCWAWWKRDPCDSETGLSHLKHAACCLAFLIHYEEGEYHEFDDRPFTQDEPI